MTSLPREVPLRVRHIAHVVSAYNICLRLEKSLQQDVDIGQNIGNGLIYIRILGYLIHHVPTDEGLRTVVYEISACTNDDSLLQVGQTYFNHYIRAFRSNKGRIPTPSNHASRPSFDTIADMINDTLEEAPQSHAGAKVKALIRDGYRCVVTGKYDLNSVETIRELQERLRSDPTLRNEPTQCAHIFSESTNSSIEPGSAKRDYAASMWAVMVRFGHKTLLDDLNGPKVHRLENVMTLTAAFHERFDRLGVWFVATREENKYNLAASNEFFLRDYPQYVTFTTPDPVNLPVPSPTYLAIHAACAKVAHLSGAAQCIDKFDRDMEDRKILDPDGASVMLLEHAISNLQVYGYGVTA